MAGKNILIMICDECKNKNYYFSKPEKQIKKLVLKKFCKQCRKHTKHKTLK
jgi:large subunit ribosomal protein L33